MNHKIKINDLKDRIRKLTPDIIKKFTSAEEDFLEYDELTKFPELKKIIIDLLTTDFDFFLSSIEWVAPRPTTFRIKLKNDQEFYLIYHKNSWEAQIEGKRYYLKNLTDGERATMAIARILRYGPPLQTDSENVDSFDDDREDVGLEDSMGDIDIPEED